jgi:hypothetical protein
MIALTFKITEVEKGHIKLVAGGGSRTGTSKMERDFTKKLLAHISRFNTSYKNIHKGNRIRMRSE